MKNQLNKLLLLILSFSLFFSCEKEENINEKSSNEQNLETLIDQKELEEFYEGRNFIYNGKTISSEDWFNEYEEVFKNSDIVTNEGDNNVYVFDTQSDADNFLRKLDTESAIKDEAIEKEITEDESGEFISSNKSSKKLKSKRKTSICFVGYRFPNHRGQRAISRVNVKYSVNTVVKAGARAPWGVAGHKIIYRSNSKQARTQFRFFRGNKILRNIHINGAKNRNIFVYDYRKNKKFPYKRINWIQVYFREK